ncbi:hypothetical protein LJC28_02795 [Dysgonomonas sp. OttesenSCG-928-D17]|nr:hypothetical protein [Dysgonomonas sp. OttesenSCG-928-D17]
MSKIYAIKANSESKVNEYCSFGIQKQNAAYVEVLKIFREAFSLVDITTVIRKK